MKRFWKEVAVEAGPAGYTISLDGRVVKTPMKRELLLPNADLAAAVATEWRDCGQDIDPGKMPMTGFANAAIDKVADDPDAFATAIAAYAQSDLLCYRADPEEQAALAERQALIWQPWLDWAAAHYGIKFTIVAGIMHKAQPPETLKILAHALGGMSIFEYAALAKIAHLTGSLILTLAVTQRGRQGAGQGVDTWSAACLEEVWQEEQWGADHWAQKNRNDREAEYKDALRFLDLVSP